MFNKKIVLVVLITFCCYVCNNVYSQELSVSKYPDYATMFIGNDKYENFNRKIFNFNLKVNKYAFRPIHVIWASVMPKFGMDRISGVTRNIEYPIRLVSTLIQRDFQSAKNETLRFFTNTTLGLGGMFDPAHHLLKLEPVQENMEQALAKCKVKQGCYLVIPVISSTTPRDLLGRTLDTVLNPSSYIATPAIAAVKAMITINRTYFMQPILKMIESTYADPYDIARKMYGLENYIKYSNYDRSNLIEEWKNKMKNEGSNAIIENSNKDKEEIEVSASRDESTSIIESNFDLVDILQGNLFQTDIILKDRNAKRDLDNLKLVPDIILNGYKPQSPVIDSMRTSLFEVSGMNNKFWADLSIWNKGFQKRLKIASINIIPNRENYKYRFILQNNRKAPVAVIYPSIGEGFMSSHSAMLGKIFYDAGYSVVILGSHFQWEFIKSMPENYRPGLPSVDADNLKMVTDKILSALEDKYKCEFEKKVVMGTSFGALMALFIGQKEFRPNEEQQNKYIAVCPPIDLLYAMKQIDKNSEDWNANELKNKVAMTAAKVIQLSKVKDCINKNNISLPFSEEEAKLITGFILHQKLSDVIYTIENSKNMINTNIYNKINQMNYSDYASKYLLTDNNKDIVIGLSGISSYLRNSDNYKIYHSLDDYLTNIKQLKQLKLYSGTKTVLFDHGAHLGFLYRPEFINSFKQEIALK